MPLTRARKRLQMFMKSLLAWALDTTNPLTSARTRKSETVIELYLCFGFRIGPSVCPARISGT
jgi:hypothetical protein